MLAASKPAVNLETNEGYEAQGEGKHQIANVTLTTTGQVRFPVGLGMWGGLCGVIGSEGQSLQLLHGGRRQKKDCESASHSSVGEGQGLL